MMRVFCVVSNEDVSFVMGYERGKRVSVADTLFALDFETVSTFDTVKMNVDDCPRVIAKQVRFGKKFLGTKPEVLMFDIPLEVANKLNDGVIPSQLRYA